MRQSISYAFLLNIVITFIFITFAVIMGIMSYYRAFKANAIITSSIEKYEGYNCLAKEEIERKLQTIAYNLPFRLNCSKFSGKNCEVSNTNNYIVISENDNASNWTYKDGNIMNSQVYCKNSSGKSTPKDCQNTETYRYTVYTYMYVDVPILSNVLKIPFAAKTSTLNEFRNLYLRDEEYEKAYDTNFIPEEIFEKNKTIEILREFISQVGADLNSEYAQQIANGASSYRIKTNPEYNAKKTIQQELENNIATVAMNGYQFECGHKINYKKY